MIRRKQEATHHGEVARNAATRVSSLRFEEDVAPVMYVENPFQLHKRIVVGRDDPIYQQIK